MMPPFRFICFSAMDILAAHSTAPRWLRRLVVLTFPVSYPALFAVMCVTLPLSMVEALALGVVQILKENWK